MRRDLYWGNWRRLRLGTLFVLTVVGLVVPGLLAYGNHILGTYPSQRGYHSGGHPDFYQEFVASDNCNQAELDAFSAIKSSTDNRGGTFGSRWPSGIRMYRALDGNACDGTGSNQRDIQIVYLTQSQWNATHSTNAGGENHSYLATSSYCAYIEHDWPCGTHPSIVHINKTKWNNTSSAGRIRLLIHETGHSQGLGHHCSSDSIMNDGSQSCNYGTWLDVTGYLFTDRNGVVNIYPNWPYP